VPKYQIDADPDNTLGHNASVRKYADPTDLGSEDQAFVHGLTPEGLTSDATDVDSHSNDPLETGAKVHRPLPTVLAGFKRIAIDTDAGSAFTLNKPNGFQSVGDPPDQGPLHEKAAPATGIGGGAPISGASWYVTQPGNEQGTAMGDERNKNYDLSSSSAPLSSITAGLLESPSDEQRSAEIEKQYGAPTAEDSNKASIGSEYGSTLEMFGVGGHPLAGGAYGSVFGINEFYDYEGDVDGYDL
jgi:hypothetical protein